MKQSHVTIPLISLAPSLQRSSVIYPSQLNNTPIIRASSRVKYLKELNKITLHFNSFLTLTRVLNLDTAPLNKKINRIILLFFTFFRGVCAMKWSNKIDPATGYLKYYLRYRLKLKITSIKMAV
jgi:hypothetical protein